MQRREYLAASAALLGGCSSAGQQAPADESESETPTATRLELAEWSDFGGWEFRVMSLESTQELRDTYNGEELELEERELHIVRLQVHNKSGEFSYLPPAEWQIGENQPVGSFEHSAYADSVDIDWLEIGDSLPRYYQGSNNPLESGVVRKFWIATIAPVDSEPGSVALDFRGDRVQWEL